MRAITYRDIGPSGVLREDDVPAPQPGDDEIRLRVHATTVNPIDWKLRSGVMPNPLVDGVPFVPGSDRSGVVDLVGSSVTGVRPGDRVFGFAGSGAAADLALLRWWARVPDGVSHAQAAAASSGGFTAISVLDMLDLDPGQTLLIEGAAGGVGSLAVQIARSRGVTVIGTARPDNHAFLRSLGATPVVYGDGIGQDIATITGGGVDAVFDTAGSGSLPLLISLLATPSQAVSIADFAAPSLGARAFVGHGASSAAEVTEIARLLGSGELTPTIAREFDLADLAEAHDLSAQGHVRGKLVVTVTS